MASRIFSKQCALTSGVAAGTAGEAPTLVELLTFGETGARGFSAGRLDTESTSSDSEELDDDEEEDDAVAVGLCRWPSFGSRLASRSSGPGIIDRLANSVASGVADGEGKLDSVETGKRKCCNPESVARERLPFARALQCCFEAFA